MHSLMDTLGAVGRTHGAAWVPVFNAVLGEEARALGARGRPLSDRRIFLFIFDDLLEHAGEAALDERGVPWAACVLPQLCVDAAGGDAALRQAAAYGLGAAAVAAPALFAPYGGEALAALFGCLDAYARRAPTAERRDNALDNAVGALLRVAAACMAPGDPARSAVLERAFALLPLTEDEEEAAAAARLLASWVAANDTQLAGAIGIAPAPGEPRRLAKALHVFAEACSPAGLLGDQCTRGVYAGNAPLTKLDRVSHHVADALARLEAGAPALLAAAAALLPDERHWPRLQRVRANPDAIAFEG
jgi:hypothetical protein